MDIADLICNKRTGHLPVHLNLDFVGFCSCYIYIFYFRWRRFVLILAPAPRLFTLLQAVLLVFFVFQDGAALNLSFVPLDIKLTNWDDLPEAFSRRRENRIQVCPSHQAPCRRVSFDVHESVFVCVHVWNISNIACCCFFFLNDWFETIQPNNIGNYITMK